MKQTTTVPTTLDVQPTDPPDPGVVPQQPNAPTSPDVQPTDPPDPGAKPEPTPSSPAAV